MENKIASGVAASLYKVLNIFLIFNCKCIHAGFHDVWIARVITSDQGGEFHNDLEDRLMAM